MIDCPKFVEMQKMFHGKFVVVIEVQPIVETQIITTDVNVVDVNVITRSKITEEHVFKDREPRKVNSVVDWEKEEWLNKSMVGTIQ
jgi:phosphopantothenate synthetase